MTSITYDAILTAPEGSRAELHDGRAHLPPQPKARHQAGGSRLNRKVGVPYDDGIGGPGGWRIIAEPEVHFELDVEVFVPDLAGWRIGRLPTLPDSHKFTVAPDWVCEILSPSTAAFDRSEKMPAYAKYGVGWLWVLDPDLVLLETYELVNGAWRVGPSFKGDDTFSAEPFPEVSMRLSGLFE